MPKVRRKRRVSSMRVITRDQTVFLRLKSVEDILRDKRGVRKALAGTRIPLPRKLVTVTRGMYRSKQLRERVARNQESSNSSFSSGNIDVQGPTNRIGKANQERRQPKQNIQHDRFDQEFTNKEYPKMKHNVHHNESFDVQDEIPTVEQPKTRHRVQQMDSFHADIPNAKEPNIRHEAPQFYNFCNETPNMKLKGTSNGLHQDHYHTQNTEHPETIHEAHQVSFQSEIPHTSYPKAKPRIRKIDSFHDTIRNTEHPKINHKVQDASYSRYTEHVPMELASPSRPQELPTRLQESNIHPPRTESQGQNVMNRSRFTNGSSSTGTYPQNIPQRKSTDSASVFAANNQEEEITFTSFRDSLYNAFSAFGGWLQ